MWFKCELNKKGRARGVVVRKKNSAKKYQLNDFHIIAAIYNTEDIIFDVQGHQGEREREEKHATHEKMCGG